VAVEGLAHRDVLWLSRDVTEEGATTAADDLRDRRQAGSRCDLVISDKLLPTDLQQLSLSLHVEGFQSLMSVARGVQVSAAYNRTDWTRAW